MSGLGEFYRNKKVFITGHSGFKGSWLCSWLLKLGAEIHGFSKGIPTDPSIFDLARLNKYVESIQGDILDYEFLAQKIDEIKPDIIFHAAAQPITTLAFDQPVKTFETNIMGTASVLDALRKLDHKCALVSITSDKSYYNQEWVWGYRETDELGGKDPYSGSKSGAEMVLRSYYHTYFKNNETKRMGVVRSGNILGGGDWGRNRIIPDCIRAWKANEAVIIRSPNSVRPWQHVVEPIYGYLLLGKLLYDDSNLNGEAFNFGPDPMQHKTVLELVTTLGNQMNKHGVQTSIDVKDNNDTREAVTLKLNCEKSMTNLGWKPILSMDENLKLTADWYFEGHWNQANIIDLCQRQIDWYEKKL